MRTQKRTIIFIWVLLPVLSLACATLTGIPPVTPTPELEPDFKPVTTPLLVTPESLPYAQVGVEYDVKIQVTQNVTPVGDISIQAGELPSGLEFIFLDGEDAAQLVGIPEEAGEFEITIFIWCFGTQVSGQTLAQKYKIIVEE